MDHTFQPSLTDDKACIKCKRSFRDHSIVAQCEACPNVGPCDLFCDMLLCKKCYAAEIAANNAALAEINKPENQEARVKQMNETIKINQLIADSNKIDQSIQLVTDIFNAQTTAIVDLLKAIDDDATIENKAFAKASTVVDRIKHFSKVLFEAKEQVILAENAIRAGQVMANQLADKLRADEREKLKLNDIQYTPTAPKTPKPKSTGTRKVSTKVKVDMTEVNVWAGKVGMPYNVIHMRMIKFNMTAEAAARTLAAELNLTIKD